MHAGPTHTDTEMGRQAVGIRMDWWLVWRAGWAPFPPPADLTRAWRVAAGGGGCRWVVNIYRFNRIYVKVKPLMDTLNAARASKAAADASLNAALGAVAEVSRPL